MIQRKQTLFLLLAAVATGVAALLNTGTTLMLLLLIVSALLCIAIIFLYKNRVRQMRWVALAFLLCVLYIFLVFFWATEAYTKHIAYLFSAAPEVSYSVGTWTPIVAAVLLFLAQRAIRKDEMKVRAADRLR